MTRLVKLFLTTWLLIAAVANVALAQQRVIIDPPLGSNAPFDCSVASATGSAQRIITASQHKHGFTLQIGAGDSNINPGYFSYTAGSGLTAGGPGALTLNPSTATTGGGSWQSPNNYPVGVDIWYIATAATKLKCNYW